MNKSFRIDSLRKFLPLKDLSKSYLEMIFADGELATLVPGVTVFENNAQCTRDYFLVSGVVHYRKILVAKTDIHAEDNEAVYPLNHRVPKGAVVVTETIVQVFSVEHSVIDLARAWSKTPLTSQSRHCDVKLIDQTQSTQEDDEDWMERLLQSPIFRNISPVKLQKLFGSFTKTAYRAGAKVIRRGEWDNQFYLIQSGTARVLISKEGVEEEAAILRCGDFFGEGALVGHTVHSATVQMLSDGVICRLNQSHFDDLLKDALFDYVDESQLQAFKASEAQDVLILDVRLLAEHKDGHLAGSYNVPISKLRDELHSFSKDITYLVAGGEDKRSEVAALLLFESGFSTYLIRSA